jgi:predicted HD superfamily hydrolase involved in NAD metabolism
MSTKRIEELTDYIERNLTEKRFNHTLGVVSEAKKLAERYGESLEKAEIAALAHDMAKSKSRAAPMTEEAYLNHGKIAAEMLKDQWLVTDEDILNAVSFHTTGREGMSRLEKIIYLADAIEQGRSYPGIEEAREASYGNLDKACIMVMSRKLEYLESLGCYIEPNTKMARDYLLARNRREDE